MAHSQHHSVIFVAVLNCQGNESLCKIGYAGVGYIIKLKHLGCTGNVSVFQNEGTIEYEIPHGLSWTTPICVKKQIIVVTYISLCGNVIVIVLVSKALEYEFLPTTVIVIP